MSFVSRAFAKFFGGSSYFDSDTIEAFKKSGTQVGAGGIVFDPKTTEFDLERHGSEGFIRGVGPKQGARGSLTY